MKYVRKKLEISNKAIDTINSFLLDENNPLINELLQIIEKYGGINEINKKAEESGTITNLLNQLEKIHPSYIKEIEWLQKKKGK